MKMKNLHNVYYSLPHLIPLYLPKSRCALAVSFSNSEIQHFYPHWESEMFLFPFALCFYSPNTICKNVPENWGFAEKTYYIKPIICAIWHKKKSSNNIVVALYQSNNNPRDRAEQLERRTRGTDLHFARKMIQIWGFWDHPQSCLVAELI